MPYRLRWKISVDFVPPGEGLGQNALPPLADTGGNAQTLTIFGSGGSQTPVSNTFTNSDVTALMATLSADATAQFDNAALQARVQGFATGGG